jgi:hypothetical protein
MILTRLENLHVTILTAIEVIGYLLLPSLANPISNLNEKLDPFGQCLLHLVNYEGIDFQPNRYPWVLSRYSVFYDLGADNASKLANQGSHIPLRSERLMNISFIKPNRLIFNSATRESTNTKEEESVSIPYEYRSFKTRWTCAVQIFLLPNLDHKTSWYIDSFGLIIPRQFYNFWNNYNPAQRDSSSSPPDFSDWRSLNASDLVTQSKFSFGQTVNIGRYLILITQLDPLFKFKRKPQSPQKSSSIHDFHAGINQLFGFNPTSRFHLLVFRIQTLQNNVHISRTWLVCMFCNLLTRKLLRVTIDSSTNRDRIDSLFYKWDQTTHKTGAYWSFLENSYTNPHERRKAYDTLENVHEQEKFLQQFRLWNMTKSLKDKAITLEMFMFISLVSPNRSIYPTNTLCGGVIGIKNQIICDNIGSTPKFDLFSLQEVLLTRREEGFTFLSCGRVNLSPISFHGFISPFDPWIWGLILLFYFGLSLGLITLRLKFAICVDGAATGSRILFEQGDNFAGNK